jgi:hypothetical protein
MGRPAGRIGGRAAFAALAATLTFGVCQAGAAVTIEREVPINSSNPYTPVPDGSVWTTYTTSSTTGVVAHLDGQNGSVIKSFFISLAGGYNPFAIGYANNRVYILVPNQIISLQVNGASGTTNPGLLASDGETSNRLQNAQFLRVSPDGTGNVVRGQSYRVGIFDLTDLTADHPFYPQSFFGVGIIAGDGSGAPFESCTVNAPAIPPSGCGTGPGGAAGPDQLEYPSDMAPDSGSGFYVTEYTSNTVTHVVPTIVNGMGGYTLDSFGSGPGSQAGQLSSPDSIRRIPGTGRVVISNPPNGRLDEFSPAGAYERSYGFGVLTGDDEFQTCGVGIGACQAGVPYQADSRSYFTQLDVVDGKLWAATELDHSIQVIDLGGGGGGGASIDLKADPVKIKKGEKATLTAKLKPCDGGGSVKFQRKAGSKFRNLGSAVAADDGCKAKKRVRINETSIFRALSRSGGETIATSPKVKVQLK